MTLLRAGAPAGEGTSLSLPPGRRTAAFVDLDALAGNYRALSASLGARGRILAVVKAEGYGHGGAEAAAAFRRAGAEWLGVATLEEAEALRARPGEGGGASLAEARILVMSGVFPGCAPRVVARALDAVVWDMEQVEALGRAARAAGRPARIHLKVDSGMGRLGVSPAEAADFLRRAAGVEGVEAAGLMSHLARADEEEGAADTRRQLEVIGALAESVRGQGLLPPLVHCANSAGGLFYPEAPGALVRMGIALYGSSPPGGAAPSLRQAMTWKGAILQVKEVAAGAPVGYGGTYRRSSPGRIAVVATGYGDGYPRLLSNRADALVGGRRVPVVGRVSMDMLALDVSGLEGVRSGDEAVLLGGQGGEFIPAAELAARAETIPYEIFCGVGVRVPRVFVRGGRAAGERVLGLRRAAGQAAPEEGP